jgi:hypothetical protein
MILITLVHTLMDYAGMCFSALTDAGLPVEAGGGLMALALSAAGVPLTEAVLAAARNWHAGMPERFANVKNVVATLDSHELSWSVPAAMLSYLTTNRTALQALVDKCDTNNASANDRAHRDALLSEMVDYCLHDVFYWCNGCLYAKTMTVKDIHDLGFLLRGETGGHHSRAEATDAKVEVKVRIAGDCYIRVVVDQAADENAGPVKRAWPKGIHHAVIAILTADGKKEIKREITTRVYNDIRMPEDSRGKLFIIKAAFLAHVNDDPRFNSNEPTFSIPLTTEDLAATLESQRQEEAKERALSAELHRREVERVQEGD